MSTPKEHISTLLRKVDMVIKSGNVTEAKDIIDSILEISPKNVYARAYRERIEELQSVSKVQPQSPPLPVDPSPLSTGTPDAATARIIPSKYEQRLSDAVVEAYKTLLNEIWKDGDVTPLERERVADMMNFFGISESEHDYLEQNARLNCYLNAIKEAWISGIRNFSSIKEQFRVSDQESTVLQGKIDRMVKALNSKGIILSLDDDKHFLLLIERLLEKHGYHSLNTTSGEEALNLLENFSPDLVLCDIAFGQKNMNGFMFYERFRSIEKFSSVPFIFISALNQKELMKTGKKIGVDDYLTKPVDNDVLLAAIEGRIRRAREIKKASDY